MGIIMEETCGENQWDIKSSKGYSCHVKFCGGSMGKSLFTRIIR